MKNLIPILFLIINCGYGQEYTNENGVFHYRDVVEVDKTQKEIRSIASKWVAINFVDSKEVSRLDTDETIIVKALFYVRRINVGIEKRMDFTMDLAFKDGRYKIEFYGLPDIWNHIGLKLPIQDPDQYTVEDFKNNCILAANISGMKKMIQMKIEKEEWVSKHYKKSKDDMEDSYKQVKNKIDAIAQSLKNTIVSSKKSDW
mgnify:CR=1 FL=1